MPHPHTAMLHYTAPPVVGGVEAVIQAHSRVFTQAGYPVTVVAGRGEERTLPDAVDLVCFPEIDSQHPLVAQVGAALEEGEVPPQFEPLTARLVELLAPVLVDTDNLIVHNVFTKHFNLPLTAALYRLLEEGRIRNCIAWCHDFTWTSPSSRSKVHPGYPWDLLRTPLDGVDYVVVSKRRQETLAKLFDCPPQEIDVIYNGVDPQHLLGLSAEGRALVERLDLLASDLLLLMPVRVTQAKNVEYALRVVAALKERACAVKLVLTGPPDPHSGQSMAYYRSLKDLRRRLGVEGEMRFVYESGPDPSRPYEIDVGLVGELFRVSDMVLMPSHREGFGMPVLEAGLVGIPVVCTAIPAAEEIGGADVLRFDAADDPARLAERILDWAQGDATHRLRRRVRQSYTWEALFRRQIEPLLRAGEAR